MKLKRDPKYVQWGITALSVICISVLLALGLGNLKNILSFIGSILSVLRPIIYGLIFAYVLNPLMVWAENKLYRVFRWRKMKEAGARKFSRALGITFALICATAIIYMFFALLLPALIDSLTTVISNASEYYATATKWIDDFATRYPNYRDFIMNSYDTIFSGLVSWLTDFVQNDLTAFASSIASQVVLIVKGAMNVFIGLVAAVYLLSSKETFLAQARKMVVALIKKEKAEHFFGLVDRSNSIFSGFINGKLLDSLIIGLICYLGMKLLDLPYPALIATVVGITNVIPFFGPFIGAIPSAVLILFISPVKCIYFVLFIFALQQLDGNVIGPYILGDAVGLPSFWILASITVAGGLFGFVGMLFGVPVFAVIYALVCEGVEERLREKGVPPETEYYYTRDALDKLNSSKPENTDADSVVVESGAAASDDDAAADSADTSESPDSVQDVDVDE